MANSWFQFKKFTIQQGQAAMKVGTDGVLLGAWANCNQCENILDIGTGTGLIALMLAQRNSKAKIDAVELDKAASIQAVENIKDSSWADRITVHNKSIQDFAQASPERYNLIVSNPPFFSQSFSAKTSQREMARDNKTLSFDALLDAVNKLMKKEGSFSVILPSDVLDEFTIKAQQRDLHLNKQTNIYPTASSNVKRVLLSFSFENGDLTTDNIVIEPHKRHEYSEEYINLCKDFYLKL